jgi:hypothetical protein
VVDAAGNITTSSPSNVTVVDSNQSPPPPTYQIGSLVTGQILVTQNSITVTANPATGGVALDRISLVVNGITVQQIKPGSSEHSLKAVTTDAYSFVFKPPAPGSYSLVVAARAANGVTASSPAVAVTAGSPSRLVNVATRMFADTGDNALIGGIIVTGTVPKHVAVRALGPSVGAAGIVGAMQDPTLELRNGNGNIVGQNDGWRSDTTTATNLTALGLQPHDDRESALLATISPGAYTGIVRGAGNTTGVALVEVYDLDDFDKNAKLANISTRGQVLGADRVMIGGFIVTGGASKKVIVRAIGPSLSASGVQGVLTNPRLELHGENGGLIASNDDWRTTQIGGVITADQKDEIIASTIPPKDDHESAIIAHLNPGSYTAIVRGVNDTTGIGLVEIYDLD